MTDAPQQDWRPRERPVRKRRRSRRIPLVATALLLLFACGIALGQALNDNPKPGGSRTTERTISLITVAPLKP